MACSSASHQYAKRGSGLYGKPKYIKNAFVRPWFPCTCPTAACLVLITVVVPYHCPQVFRIHTCINADVRAYIDGYIHFDTYIYVHRYIYHTYMPRLSMHYYVLLLFLLCYCTRKVRIHTYTHTRIHYYSLSILLLRWYCTRKSYIHTYIHLKNTPILTFASLSPPLPTAPATLPTEEDATTFTPTSTPLEAASAPYVCALTYVLPRVLCMLLCMWRMCALGGAHTTLPNTSNCCVMPGMKSTTGTTMKATSKAAYAPSCA